MIIGAYVFGGVGGFFLILGVIFVMIGKMKFKCTAETEGRIIDMCLNAYDYNNGNSGNVAVGIWVGSSSPGMYCPIFAYRVNGVEYTRASNVSWNRGQIKRKMNKPRTIYYNPENPEQASLTKQSAFAVIGKIFIPLGVVCVVAGLLIAILI